MWRSWMMVIAAVFASACLADPVAAPDAAASGPVVVDGGTALPFTPGTCPTDTACGGEIMGTWKFFSGCVVGEDVPVRQYCPHAAYELRPIPVGTLTFNPAGTYELVLATGMEGDVAYPPACLEGEPGLTQRECNMIGAAVASVYACLADGAGGCHCRLNDPVGAQRRETGIYLADEGQVLLGDLRHYYCVSGDRMLIRGPQVAGEAQVFTLFRDKRQ